MSSDINTKREHFNQVAGRLRVLLSVKSDLELAEALGMKPNTFANRKKSGSIPYEEITAVASKMGISLDSVFAQNNSLIVTDEAHAAYRVTNIDVQLLTRLIEEMDRASILSNSAIPAKDKGEIIARSYADIAGTIPNQESRLDAARVVGGLFEKIAALYKGE